MSLSGKPNQLDFQPTGDLLLVRSGKGEVIFWSWRDGKQLPWAEKLVGVGSAQFSSDGASVALGFLSGEAQIRKVSDGELLATIRHQGQIKALAFSPDGKLLAVASDSARVWDINGQAFLDPDWRHPQPVSALVFNRKGDRLITTCTDKLVRTFAVESGQDRKDPLYAPVVHAVASPPALIDEDRIFVTVSGDSELTRWEIATGKPASAVIHTKPFFRQGIVASRVVASPDGNWFVTGGTYAAELYAADAKQPPVYLSHKNFVTKSRFSPDNTMLLSVSWDQTARLWSLPHGQPLGLPLKHMAIVEECAWSHDARYVATAQNDGLIRVWQRPVDNLVIAQESGWGQRPRVSFDGRFVAPGLWHEPGGGSGYQSVNRVRVMATANGQPAGADISLPGALVDSCMCGDNRAVAAVSLWGNKGQLGVWDVATGSARFEPIMLPDVPISVAARPRSGQLAVICLTGDLLVIDDKTGKNVLKLRHDGWRRPPDHQSVQVNYTPDGKALVSLGGGPTATVNVRDADSGQLRFAPLHPSVGGSAFRSFSVSADSRLIATMAVVKNAAQVWDLATGRALSEPLPHPGDFYGLFSVRFSPDGRYLLTGHKDGQARYWDWQAAKLACPPMAHDDECFDVAITPDGRFALTAIRGRTEIHVWDLTRGRRVAPPLRLGLIEGESSHTLAITPDGRRALVSFARLTTSKGMDLSVVDLEALLSPSSTPTADLALLAELAAAQRIELGDLSGLTTDQWQERWNLLRERNPDLVRSFIIGPKSATR
jgi:WD40 repeat protein